MKSEFRIKRRRDVNGDEPTSQPGLATYDEKKAEETIVRSSGRITSTTSDLLQRTIRGLIPGAKRIVLDLSEVTYIDSSGIGALVSVFMAASRAQCHMEMANPQPRIRDLFELSRLQAVFESHGGYRGLTSD